MNHDKVENLAAELLSGAIPDCLPDELNAAVSHIGSLLASSSGAGVEQVRRALGVLNNERLFRLTRTLAESWNAKLGFDLTVEKRLVQAMIELDDLDDAQERLKHAIELTKTMDSQLAKVELGEFQGQQGRIAKQRFVRSQDPDELARAIDHYAARYRDSGRPYFHGINVVALVAAQERLDTSLQPPKDLQLPRLAQAVLADLRRKISNGDDSQWPLATASEACLALNRCDDAELWLHRFLLHPQTHPFHIQSYSRQLREIWLGNALRNTTCADRLSSIIDLHVMRTQNRWSMSPEMLKTAQTDPESLERNFSGERTFTVAMVKKMLEKCGSVGCVTDTNGRRIGTGFLIAAGALGIDSRTELVFVTNAHVISDTVKDAIPPANAWVTFELESSAKGKLVSHKVAPKVLFTSPPGDPGITAEDRLDVTVVELESWPEGSLALQTNFSLPTPSRKTRVFVVGHPSGDALQLSLHDSELLDVCDHDRLLHYRTPTEPGSSGSPVFNTNWEVVALHHAGSSAMPRLRGKGQYEANEGISIRSIRGGIIASRQ